VPVHVIYELGSYSLPARFSHWTFGRDYHRQKTSYEYGMSKIYEIVFNTDPCQAFLMDSNSMLSHKLTIAHVIGHCHFFKHNDYFSHTDRRMVEKVRLHRDRIAEYEQEFGWREVEEFLDAVMCVEEAFRPDLARVPAAQWRAGRRHGPAAAARGAGRRAAHDRLRRPVEDDGRRRRAQAARAQVSRRAGKGPAACFLLTTGATWKTGSATSSP
jgi:spore cortex formation protein SpoVR/YcgB (stage V sporulation)